uniref:DUF6570 domain-containing protein n=1 Tax=Amphimedon queenslandica TaxID=400682 RepID=A0A1X7U1P7_AMPQE
MECRRCAHDRHIPKLFSKGNNINPGVVPAQLQGLSQAEEMLISAVLPVMSIYKLPHGQYGYSGHVLNFPQSFATSLPRLAADIIQSEVEVTSDEATTEDHYCSSFVPNAAPPDTERETIQQALGQSQSSTLMWPSVGGTPINEFTTEGYFSMAFPTLFPTGAADYNGIRSHRIRTGDYFTHLVTYDDGRFAKHPRFRFFALNTEMRWRANEIGRFYIKQHPAEAHLTVHNL